MRKQADALKVCPIPDACLLVMAQRTARLLDSPESRSLICLVKNSPDQVEGYLEYLQPTLYFELLSGMFVKMLLTWNKTRNTSFHFDLLGGLSVNLLSTWSKPRNTAFSIAQWSVYD
jgi:hypothetical protein